MRGRDFQAWMDFLLSHCWNVVVHFLVLMIEYFRRDTDNSNAFVDFDYGLID